MDRQASKLVTSENTKNNIDILIHAPVDGNIQYNDHELCAIAQTVANIEEMSWEHGNHKHGHTIMHTLGDHGQRIAALEKEANKSPRKMRHKDTC